MAAGGALLNPSLELELNHGEHGEHREELIVCTSRIFVPGYLFPSFPRVPRAPRGFSLQLQTRIYLRFSFFSNLSGLSDGLTLTF